jgi:hypothetical protein
MALSNKRSTQLYNWVSRATPAEHASVVAAAGVSASYFKRLSYGYIPEPDRALVQKIVIAIQEFNASLDPVKNGKLPHLEMSDFEFPGDE